METDPYFNRGGVCGWRGWRCSTGDVEIKARFCFNRKPCLFGDCDRYVKKVLETGSFLHRGTWSGPRFTGEFGRQIKEGCGDGEFPSMGT